MNSPPNHIHIARLDLDLRGVAPDCAREAASLVGPALQRHLSRPPATSPSMSPDLISVPANATPRQLADAIALRLAGTVRRQRGGSKGDRSTIA